MQSVKYLNVILTTIAILLALQLWTSWSGPSLDQSMSWTTPAHAAGIPNAGHQRQQIVNQLKDMSVKLDQLNDQFRSGKARVRIGNQSD